MPVGVATREDQKAINSRRREDNAMGKIYRRAARSGDLATLDVLNRKGFSYKGIENVDDKRARYSEEANMRKEIGLNRTDRAPQKDGAGGNTTATESVPDGSSDPIVPSQVSLAQADAVAKQASNDAKAFGSGEGHGFASLAAQRKEFVDIIRNNKGDSRVKEQAMRRGKELGLSAAQVEATLAGEDDLSPKAIKERQAAITKNKYNKAYGESDSKVGNAISNLDPSKFSPEQIAQIKANAAKLTPEERKQSTELGAQAGREYGEKIDYVLNRGRKAIDEVRSGIAEKQTSLDDLRSRAKEKGTDPAGSTVGMNGVALSDITKANESDIAGNRTMFGQKELEPTQLSNPPALGDVLDDPSLRTGEPPIKNGSKKSKDKSLASHPYKDPDSLFPADMPESQKENYRRLAARSSGFDVAIGKGLEWLSTPMVGKSQKSSKTNWEIEKAKKYKNQLKSDLRAYGHLPQTASIDTDKALSHASSAFKTADLLRTV